MRVFVSEFLVGGGSSGMATAVSMRREGLAMLQAVTTDVARLSDWTSVTTLEAGFSPSLAGDVIQVANAAEEALVFERLLTQVDAVLVIAPETEGILAERCRRVSNSQTASWNCSPESIELCGDKLRLANHLQSNNLPTIPTSLLDLTSIPDNSAWPQVLKPRDGAGSNLTFLVNNRTEYEQAAQSFRQAGSENKCISQPFVQGYHLSIGVNISLDGSRVECMRVGEQKLSSDGRFQYLGGSIPAKISSPECDAIERVVRNACRAIPGLAGYIGFDLLLPNRGDPLIVEINPRLTTSYVGYRQIYSTPIPQRWLSTMDVPAICKNLSIEWDVSSMP